MTDFEPCKDRIWKAVKDDSRNEFDDSCRELMEKAVDDLWRVGWELNPKGIEDVYALLDDLAKWCHEQWKKAMDCGDAPYEDVSPGEGLLNVKRVIKEAIGKCNENDGGDDAEKQD